MAGRNARSYAVYGALFGALFPIVSTVLYATSELGGIDQIWHAQRTISLLWIIDTAPAFLGLFAWLAGRRQDAVELLVPEVERANATLANTNAELEKTNARLADSNTALIEANRLKSQFLANMSHELRTPLNAIIGFSRIVLKKTQALIPERQAKNLATIHESGKHLLELVNDLLDIERIEAGILSVHYAPVDITNLVADVIKGLLPAATEKGLTLECQSPDRPIHLVSDAVRLRQILDNLVNNAIKYSDTGVVRVELELGPPGAPGMLRITVVDQGLGIAAEHHSKIFDSFHQVDGSATRAQGGVGLGLHLVSRLIQLLEGTISMTSQLGKGSRFTVNVPAKPVEALAPPAPLPREMNGTGAVVLIIDDQRDALEILQTELVEAGFRVESALSGEEGLAKAAATRPAAILLDMVMPGMDGWAVLKAMRSDPVLSSTPVIITSMLDNTPRAWDLGIVGWLTKPVGPDDFLAVFRRIGIGARANVMIVEDDRNTREMLVELLRDLGFESWPVEDGRAAVEKFDHQLPHAIVLDLMIPHLDGFGVLEHLRARPGGRDVPVIVYSAKDLTPEERDRLSGSVVQIIAKGSSDIDEVAHCVRRAIARDRTGQEHE